MNITISMPRAKTLITMPVLRTFEVYGYTFAVHYSVRGAEYTVSEITSGAAVCHAETLTGIIREAKDMLEKAGGQRVAARIVASAQVSVRGYRAVTADLLDPVPVTVDGMRYEPLLRLRAEDIHDADTMRYVWYAAQITARRVGARKLVTLYEDADGVMHRTQPSPITYLHPKREVA